MQIAIFDDQREDAQAATRAVAAYWTERGRPCHNSCIVNLRYVTDFCRSGFTLQNGAIIPISRSYYPRVKELFTVYVSQRR